MAWPLALLGAIGCAASTLGAIAVGLGTPQLIVTAIFVAMALLGGTIARRRPQNSVGWLMVGTGLVAIFFILPTEYGYDVTLLHPGAGPFGTEALWLGAWSWTPLLGVVMPSIAVRFPNGSVVRRWRHVDWIVALGTLGLAASIALASPAVLAGYLPVSHVERFAAVVRNPLGLALPDGALDVLRVSSVALIVAGYALAIAALIDRYRSAEGDERIQILWFAYACGLAGAAAAYALTAWGFLGEAIGDALLPLDFVAFGVPVAITIGILRYRLFDIELVVNRTLVYGSLTALLAAGYAATITLLQRLFVGASGTTSNLVYVAAAFVVVVLFSPVRDWLQHKVDRRLGVRNPLTMLNELRASTEGVLDALEPTRAAARFLDKTLVAFDAKGGALYLGDEDRLRLVHGQPLVGPAALETPIRHGDRSLGRLDLGPRRGGRDYSPDDRRAIREAADAVAAAIDLGERLGL